MVDGELDLTDLVVDVETWNVFSRPDEHIDEPAQWLGYACDSEEG